MVSKTKKLMVLLVIGLVFPSILTFNFNFNKKHEPNIVYPKASGGYTESFIHIDGSIPNNWSDTESLNEWCIFKNGYYIIENVTINASNSPTGSGILIENSFFDFIIRNCTVYNAGSGFDAGIKLETTNKGTIYNNTCSNNGKHGILLHFFCYENNISENVVINNQDDGIYLTNTCTKNKITNNYLYNNTKNGLSLYNKCDHNNITGNTANDNGQNGILLTNNCNYNNISGNNVSDNMKHGIKISYMTSRSDNNTITNNTAIENPLSGIYLERTENNIITGNTVYGNYRHGIHLRYYAKWNNLTKNIIHDNTLAGIYLESTSDNNKIKNNTINRNDVGILLSSSNYNNISDNIIKDNNWCIFETGCTGNILINNDCTPPTVQEPIFIDGSAIGVGAPNWTWALSQPWCYDDNGVYIIENLKVSGFGFTKGIEIINSDDPFIIRNCEIFNSQIAGIYFDNVNNSQLIENNCSNNLGTGIYLNEYCSNNKLTENVAIDNNNDGIFIGDYCDNNTISQSEASYNGATGIHLSGEGRDSSYNNTILENTVENNDYGIQLIGACHFTLISRNIIRKNNFGLSFDSSCSNNSGTKNFFFNNGKHAIDDGADNNWNSTTIGNYWDNWTSPDVNSDGIVDDPYTYIGGSAGSIDYLPIAEDGAPRITIIFPSDGQRSGILAPTFIVEIVDIYVFEMWYTLDGGLNNYTFIENGTIDQAVWDILPEGSVTIRFYARDIAGNVAFEEVTVLKVLGLDPGVLAVIVFVSVIGGLTIVGVILGILVKKGKISVEKLKKFSFKRK